MAKDNKKLVQAITSQEENFAQWYTDICVKAELVEYSSVKGFIILRPYGQAIWELIQKDMDARFKATGHENVAMPVLIPESLLQKEGELVNGFAPEVAWVTMGGSDKLEERLAVRPTSETIKKMGKTQSGAVWLDPNKTSPFEFYQYWRNVADADVLKCLRMLTFLPLEQIDEMDKWEGSQLNTAKEILAYELTKLVHGEEEAEKAQAAAKALFSSGNAANMPTYELTEDDFNGDEIDILSILQKSGLAPSRSEARRNVEQGGVSVDGNQVKDIKAVFTKDQLAGEGMVVKRGKKNFKKVVLK